MVTPSVEIGSPRIVGAMLKYVALKQAQGKQGALGAHPQSWRVSRDKHTREGLCSPIRFHIFMVTPSVEIGSPRIVGAMLKYVEQGALGARPQSWRISHDTHTCD